jgi:NTE family protein
LGWNIDWSPVAIMLEAAGLVVSPYTNPFYTNALAPLLEAAFPTQALERLNGAAAPRLFVTAVNVRDNGRTIFTQPHVRTTALRASACLPSEFRAVSIDGVPYWDGGYIGSRALTPLIEHARDTLLVMVNPLHRDDMPPRTARAILDRLNKVTFNACAVLETNAIEEVNRLLAELEAAGVKYAGRYKPLRMHLIRDDRFTEQLGFVFKNSRSGSFLSALHDAGYGTADAWLAAHRDALGRRWSCDIKAELTNRVLKAPLPPAGAG